MDRGNTEDRLPTVGPGAGVPLTRGEKRRLDFGRTTVVHARWCKAAAWKYSVRDWTAHYDHTLTVDEMLGIYSRMSTDPGAGGGRTLRETSHAAAGLVPRWNSDD